MTELRILQTHSWDKQTDKRNWPTC